MSDHEEIYQPAEHVKPGDPCPFCGGETTQHDSSFCDLDVCWSCRANPECLATQCGHLPRNHSEEFHAAT